MLSLVPRVLVSAHVPPRPTVKTALLHARDVVRDKIVAQGITLVNRAPEISSVWADPDAAAGIADSIGIHLQLAIGRVTIKDVCTIFLGRSRIRIVDIRFRSNRHEQLLPVLREFDSPGVVSA